MYPHEILSAHVRSQALCGLLPFRVTGLRAKGEHGLDNLGDWEGLWGMRSGAVEAERTGEWI